MKIEQAGFWVVLGEGDIPLAWFSYEKDAEIFKRAHQQWYSRVKQEAEAEEEAQAISKTETTQE